MVRVNVTIRRWGTVRDRNALLTIFRRRLPNLRSELSALESLDPVADGQDVVVVAEAGDRVVAGAWARNRTVGTEAELEVWTLEALACRDDHEGQGAGSRVLDRVVDEAASRGAKIVYGTCSPTVAPFYLARGFDRTPNDASLIVGADAPRRAALLSLAPGECFILRATSIPAPGRLHTAVDGPVLEAEGLFASLLAPGDAFSSNHAQPWARRQ